MFEILLILLIQTIHISIPYYLAAVGGVFSERAGVINIALEGLLLIGAFFYIVGTWYGMKYFPQNTITYSAPIFGLIVGISSGIMMGFILSFLCITLKSDHILIGIAINIFAIGFTKFANEIIFHSPSNSEMVINFPKFMIFNIDYLYILNDICHPLIILTFLIFIISTPFLFKTVMGLRLRAVGENPASADYAGISVGLYKYIGVVIGCGLASLGGVWLSLDQGRFAANMSAGRGYIAIAAMIIGKWHPRKAAYACLLFGFVEAFQLMLQSKGVKIIPNQVIQMLPYLVTIFVMMGLIGKSTPPAADGLHYEKEKHDY